MYLPKIGLSAKYKLAEIYFSTIWCYSMLMNKMPFLDYIFVFKTCLGSAENASCLDIAFLGMCHFAGSAFIEHMKWNFALHKRCKDAQTTFTYNSK